MERQKLFPRIQKHCFSFTVKKVSTWLLENEKQQFSWLREIHQKMRKILMVCHAENINGVSFSFSNVTHSLLEKSASKISYIRGKIGYDHNPQKVIAFVRKKNDNNTRMRMQNDDARL